MVVSQTIGIPADRIKVRRLRGMLGTSFVKYSSLFLALVLKIVELDVEVIVLKS